MAAKVQGIIAGGADHTTARCSWESRRFNSPPHNTQSQRHVRDLASWFAVVRKIFGLIPVAERGDLFGVENQLDSTSAQLNEDLL